jgi:hypothetical protein
VCSDDSSFIASIHIKDFHSVTLEMLVKTILPDGLKVDSETLLIEFDKRMIYEYDPDMSDDEIALFQGRLTKSLTQLNFKNYSILYV